MYTFRQTIIEICKIFLFSIACSIVFAVMIYRDSARPNVFISFVLVVAAAVFFLYICYANWARLYDRIYSPSEYYVPAICSTLAYASVSAFAYFKRISFYMWLFLPTRFLEPKLNGDWAFLSVVAVYLALLIIALIVPMANNYRR